MEDIYDKRLPSFRLDFDAAFNQYVESFGWGGVYELARRIGKSQEFVTKRIQLLHLPVVPQSFVFPQSSVKKALYMSRDITS